MTVKKVKSLLNLKKVYCYKYLSFYNDIIEIFMLISG